VKLARLHEILAEAKGQTPTSKMRAAAQAGDLEKFLEEFDEAVMYYAVNDLPAAAQRAIMADVAAGAKYLSADQAVRFNRDDETPDWALAQLRKKYEPRGWTLVHHELFADSAGALFRKGHGDAPKL
jgi:hypothetical protein